ncbi:MAG TPA: hypothetical protein VFQ76_11755, partial [Longimicrobiaceae bacterium]|nr:hypothetical protein [Longimicrobiaceae bacterium]
MTDPYSEDPHLQSVYRQVLARVEGIDGITGVDIGLIYENGERTDERGVRVYTPDAKTWRDLASRLPETIEGVKISRLL